MLYNLKGILLINVWDIHKIVAAIITMYNFPNFNNIKLNSETNCDFKKVNPVCLYNSKDNTKHSPIIGWAYDGYPIYGSFGYSDPLNPRSTLKRMRTSYRFRRITARTTLPNGQSLASSKYGPPVNATFPLGSFQEDYEYVQGYGDLDVYNGRKCITPDYPNGMTQIFSN